MTSQGGKSKKVAKGRNSSGSLMYLTLKRAIILDDFYVSPLSVRFCLIFTLKTERNLPYDRQLDYSASIWQKVSHF